MIVLDASVVIELLLGTQVGAKVARRIASPEDSIHAPHLLDVEVAQVLRRYERTGAISSSRAQGALDDLRDFDLTRHPHDIFLGRIWQLRENLSAYDASYVAVTETLEAILLTTDARLVRAPSHRACIELVEAN